MGFSSFICSKSGLSIPAFPYANLPQEASDIVWVLPDNTIVKGFYDGYQAISGYDKRIIDVIGEFYEKTEGALKGREEAYSLDDDIDFIAKPGTDEDGLINYELPCVITGNCPSELLGLSMNDLSSKAHELGYHSISAFHEMNKLVKIVRADHYNGETYEQLKTSQHCPEQGYFYENSTVKKIINSLKAL